MIYIQPNTYTTNKIEAQQGGVVPAPLPDDEEYTAPPPRAEGDRLKRSDESSKGLWQYSIEKQAGSENTRKPRNTNNGKASWLSRKCSG